MSPVDVLETVAGAAALLGTTSSVVRTLVVPRGVSPVFGVAVARAVRGTFRAAAHRRRSYEGMDVWLTPMGPITLLVLLVTWLVGFLVSYALLIAGISGITLPLALRQAGSSLFTLGFDSSRASSVTVLDFLAAATGPLVIALLIAYLPTLYSAYNRRETEVTLLESRAGNPAWGPEILARHQAVGLMANLPDFYAGWERWSADVAESHTNYPALIDFRSPTAYRSWIVGLLAVLDSAALLLSCSPGSAPTEARLCLRMGFVSLREIARVTRIPFDPDPDPDSDIDLTREEFEVGYRRMQLAGLPLDRTPDEAWPDFRGWRVNYESIAYEVARRVDAVPAPWAGPRDGGFPPIEPVRPVDRRPGGITGDLLKRIPPAPGSAPVGD